MRSEELIKAVLAGRSPADVLREAEAAGLGSGFARGTAPKKMRRRRRAEDAEGNTTTLAGGEMGESEIFEAKVGTRVSIMHGSGVDSGQTGTVIDWSKVKTNDRGVPKLTGEYHPLDNKRRSRERLIQLDKGGMTTMFANRLRPVTEMTSAGSVGAGPSTSLGSSSVVGRGSPSAASSVGRKAAPPAVSGSARRPKSATSGAATTSGTPSSSMSTTTSESRRLNYLQRKAIEEGHRIPTQHEIEATREVLGRAGYEIIAGSDPGYGKDVLEGKERYQHPDGTQVHIFLSPDNNQAGQRGKWVFHAHSRMVDGWGSRQLGETLMSHHSEARA